MRLSVAPAKRSWLCLTIATLLLGACARHEKVSISQGVGVPPGEVASDEDGVVDEESPRGDIIVRTILYGPNLSKPVSIWLIRRDRPQERELLFEESVYMNRWPTVLMSPDERWLIINDRPFSNEHFIRLFKRKKRLRYEEVQPGRVNERVWIRAAKQYGMPSSRHYCHRYVWAVRWAENSEAVFLQADGYGGDFTHSLDGWNCVLDVKTLRVTTAGLEAVNRAAFKPREQ
jgi:hypothetical protein